MNRLFQYNFISFFDIVIRLVKQGKAIETVSLNSSKAFDSISNVVFVDKMERFKDCTVKLF